MADAFASLPLLSKDWTNYNPSDPGMTILENLTLFETLQGELLLSLVAQPKQLLAGLLQLLLVVLLAL